MDHLIGQKFSLISKSEIRYVGILHAINPEQSTIALEQVFSFGTEDRKHGAEFVAPSNQKFDYIVFRGSDVKDIKVAEDQKENEQPRLPNVPNDPAILNSSRPPTSSQGPPPPNQSQPPQGFPPQQQFPGYYNPYGYGPPPPGNFRPGPGFPPYGPPPGATPGGPPGWFNAPQNPFPQPPGFGQGPGSFAPPGQRGPPGPPQPPQGPQQKTTSELPVDVPDSSKAATPKASTPSAPTPPVESKPSVADVVRSTAGTGPTHAVRQPLSAPKAPVPAASKRGVIPAIPAIPVAQKAAPPIPTATNGAVAKPVAAVPTTKPAVSSNTAMAEANRQATAAVAAAMAKLPQAGSTAKPPNQTNPVEELTQSFGQIRTADAAVPRGRGRGRGASRNFTQGRKVEVPKDDYDFETANAKFNKEDLIKEAIASGSPIGESAPDGNSNGILDSAPTNGIERKDSIPSSVSGTNAQAYNRSSSFFDNISSELKDREDAKAEGGRGRRGEEIKKNIETFGQGSVDGGFRGGYRGRGRGRGFGRGGPRGYGGGRGSGYRGRGRGGAETFAAAAAPAQSS